MQEFKGIKVIGCGGLSRAGKDTFCSIAKNILEKNGYKTKQFSFAEQLKKEVAPFLKDQCGVDVYTTDSELKKDIRDFFVWYGTTWWRKRDPKRWIRAVDLTMKAYKDDIDVALISDIRYLTEGEWVHSWGGYIVHVSAWKWLTKQEIAGGCYYGNDEKYKKFFDAPNEQERINDPIVKDMADYKLEWEAKGLTPEGAVADKELQIEVLKALNSCYYFSEMLSL